MRSGPGTEPRVRYADEEPNGLAEMVGGLLAANLARGPRERRLLRTPSVVALEAVDAGVAVTLRITSGGVEVMNGASGAAHLRVRAASTDLIGLASTPLRMGLPDAWSPRGRAAIGSVIRRRVRIDGLLRHPGRALRLAALLSVR